MALILGYFVDQVLPQSFGLELIAGMAAYNPVENGAPLFVGPFSLLADLLVGLVRAFSKFLSDLWFHFYD